MDKYIRLEAIGIQLYFESQTADFPDKIFQIPFQRRFAAGYADSFKNIFSFFQKGENFGNGKFR